MDHASVKKNLSAYLDGAVTPEEKALIEEHLEGCPECRAELKELAAAVTLLRSLGEEEPPPWLSVRVMARIKEDAAAKGGFLRRLFSPFGWKLPVEVAALAFLTVTGYLVYRSVSPHVGSPLPQVQESRQAAEAPAQPAEEKPSGNAGVRKKERAAGKPARPERRPEPSTAAPAPAPPPAPRAPAPANQVMPAERAEDAAKGIRSEEFRSETGAALRREKSAAAPPHEAAAAPSGKPETMRLQLQVENRNAAIRETRDAARRSGGTADWVASEGGEGAVVVRLDRERLREFLDRLPAIGSRLDRTELPSGDEEILNLVIQVSREPASEQR